MVYITRTITYPHQKFNKDKLVFIFMIGLIPLFAAGFLVLVLVILIVWKLIKLMMVVLLLSILLLILWYFGPL